MTIEVETVGLVLLLQRLMSISSMVCCRAGIGDCYMYAKVLLILASELRAVAYLSLYNTMSLKISNIAGCNGMALSKHILLYSKHSSTDVSQGHSNFFNSKDHVSLYCCEIEYDMADCKDHVP